jgi:hypothetical protein
MIIMSVTLRNKLLHSSRNLRLECLEKHDHFDGIKYTAGTRAAQRILQLLVQCASGYRIVNYAAVLILFVRNN